MADTRNIPRWMIQDTPSIRSATEDIKVVTPDDLQMASQMYGQFSQQMFGVAEQLGMALNFLRADHRALVASEHYQATQKELYSLQNDPEVMKDSTVYAKKAKPIVEKYSKGLGFFEGRAAKNLLMQGVYHDALKMGQNQIDAEQARVMKNKQSDWNNESKTLLSQIDNGWDTNTKQQYKDVYKAKRREKLNWLSDVQHEEMDKQFEKEYEIAELVNPLFKNNNFIKPVERDKFLKNVDEYIKKNPGSQEEVDKLLNNAYSIYGTFENKIQMVQKQAVANYYISAENEYLAEQDPVKRKAIYSRIEKEVKGLDSQIQKKWKQFGYTENLRQITPSSKRATSQQNAMAHKMGMDGTYTLDQATDFYHSGKWTDTEYSKYKQGLSMATKINREQEERFNNRLKGEFGISIKQSKTQGGQLMLLGMKDSDRELRDYILEQKSNINITNPEQYDLQLEEIFKQAKQKKIEIEQKKQQIYGGKSKKDALIGNFSKGKFNKKD